MSRGHPRVPRPLPGLCQTITTSGASARTLSGVGDQTRVALIAATQAAHYAFGDSAVVATTSDTFIPAGGEHLVTISPGQFVAAIQVDTAGSVFVSEMDS